MLPNEFANQSLAFWTEYLQRVQKYADAEQLSASDGCRTYFPNLLICTETPNIFLAELVGIQDRFDGLRLKRQQQESAVLYVNQLPMPTGPTPFRLLEDNLLRDLCIGHKVDITALQKRFPVVELFPTRIVLPADSGIGSVIQFADTFESSQIENCVVVNRLGSIFRAKHILLLTMVSRGLSPVRYRQFLNNLVSGEVIKGVHTVPPNKERDYVIASQFQSMYLAPNLRETTIGDFLNKHPSILLRAFSARRHIHEPHLPWLENAGRKTETAINPDLLLERVDGRVDIYDLKTAALDRVSLTKGPRSRRRFIDYVEEGIAQLANYREYFTFAKNVEYTREKYGVTVCDPLLTLVVGSYENAQPDEIVEASRKLRDIALVDYDTMTQLFLSAPPD